MATKLKDGKMQTVVKEKILRKHVFGGTTFQSDGVKKRKDDVFQKSFRCFTKVPDVKIFFIIPGGDKKDVVYLGKTTPQTAFNENIDKFCIVTQNKGGGAKDPQIVFDVSAYSESPNIVFLNKEFDFVHLSDCIEIPPFGKWGNKEEKYICEKHMYAVSFKVDGSFKRPTVEEWTIEKDKRFVNGAVLLQIKSLQVEEESYIKALKVATDSSIK